MAAPRRSREGRGPAGVTVAFDVDPSVAADPGSADNQRIMDIERGTLGVRSLRPSHPLRAGLDLIALALVAFYLAVFVACNVWVQGDMRSYWIAARCALAGFDPYRPGNLDAMAGTATAAFVYPPITLVPFSLLAQLPFAAAAGVWIGIKIALLAVLVVTWRGWLAPRDRVLLPLSLVAVFGWNGAALWDLGCGNVALIECVLLWLAFGCFVAGHRPAFGALVVAASCFKLMPAAFLLLLLVPTGKNASNPVRLLASVLLLSALVLGPVAVGPAAQWDRFFEHLPSASTLGESNLGGLAFATVVAQDAGLTEPMASRTAVLAWLAFGAGLVGLSLPFLRGAWQARDPRRWVMCAVFLYVLVAPRPMAYGFLLLAPAPLFFSPRPFHGPLGRLALAVALSAQGFARSAHFETHAVAYLYAPFLLTLGIWLLVVGGESMWGGARSSDTPSQEREREHDAAA